MNRKLVLSTGDVTQGQSRWLTFRLEFADRERPIFLSFNEGQATIEQEDWSALVAQVRARTPTKWKYSNMDGPIGQPDMQRLLTGVGNTPSFQLFLAGFDVAQIVGLVSNLDDQVVLSRCISLEARVPNVVTQKGLFFIPDSLFEESTEGHIQELLENNKLCRLTASIAEFAVVVKYYIPYATPIGFPRKAGPEATELWERIRTYYYAFR